MLQGLAIASQCLATIVEETHFRQIYFAVHNFKYIYRYIYIYVYKFFNNYMTRRIFFEEICKNWQSEKTAQVKRTNAPFLLLFFK